MTQHTVPPTVAEPASALVLDARDVAIHFGGVKAVDGVTMEIAEGKIFGLLGPNGSGKSTILAGITRLVPLKSGSLTFDGRPYDDVPTFKLARWGMARTFQTVRLLGDLTVEQNILLGADVGRSSGVSRRAAATERKECVADVIDRTGLAKFVKWTPSELSYGVQRRVEIARAIVMQPRLLLLDEPVAGMTKSEKLEIAALLSDLRAQGLTQLLVEHDVQMMVDTCDHLYAMNFGKLIGEGVPADVVKTPAVQEAYMGKGWRADA
ncbi:ABC transporter ATP-binding protein [Nocardioides sediminis]|uniref:ABC transporter ATP-binding protein n=1 Tax=Nocardioides sediminis TaxID=433648 RepID=UPI000D31F455|nr:ABC transporter ATP-binding protein [Nocardioides sediminis]